MVAPGLLRKPEYKFVRMQFAMAALSTGYLLHIAEKTGTFHDAASLYKAILGDIHGDFADYGMMGDAASLYKDLLGDFPGSDKLQDRAAHLKTAFPAGKMLSKAAVGKAKAMGRKFTDSMLKEVNSALPKSFVMSERMQDSQEKRELVPVMTAILKKSLLDSGSVLRNVEMILDVSGDKALDDIMGDYSPMINQGLQV